MSRRNSRPVTVFVLLAALWLASPAAAAPLSQPAQPAGPLTGLLEWFEGLLERFIPPPPQTEPPGEWREPADSTKPIDEGGNRGGTIDPNGGGVSGIEHMVINV